MNSPELDNLVKLDHLLREPPTEGEVEGLLRSGRARLEDAANESLSLESRFDLAYNAAHALSLAGMRSLGYRPQNRRYLVFQCLPHTLGLGSGSRRVLAKAHELRNLAEYEGEINVDGRLVLDVIAVAHEVLAALLERRSGR